MHKNYQNGDVVIKSAELSNATSRMSLMGQIIAFDVFEDMAKPTLFAAVHISDAINMLGNFPIIGEETLTLSFETPGMSEAVTYVFRVFDVSNIQHSDNRTSLGYTLKCVSEEHMKNGMLEVAQSFVDTLSNVVLAVGTNYLRSRKKIAIEPTKGVQTVVSPRWAPLECIDFARRNAVSVRNASSSYVFFENQAGFHFKTVEQLLLEGRNVGSRVFTFIQNPSAVEQPVAYRSILEYEHIQRPDTVSAALKETVFTETETFDMFTKTSRKADFKLNEQFGKFVTADAGGATIPWTSSYVREVNAADPTRLFIVRDKTRPDDYFADAAAGRSAYRELLNGNIIRLLVHGDSGLAAGNVIELKLPEIVGTTGARKQDEQYSGNYIILRLRHIVTTGPKPRHEISMDCARTGVRA